MMHPSQMLTEIVQTGPALISSRAVFAETQVQDLGAAFRLLLVNTFLMAGEVVDGSEAFFAGTVGFIAFEGFLVSGFVFPLPFFSLEDGIRCTRLGDLTFCPTDTSPSTYTQDNRIEWCPGRRRRESQSDSCESGARLLAARRSGPERGLVPRVPAPRDPGRGYRPSRWHRT